ncbi:MAG: hypothetical protein IJ087_13850, partial [Eggerthellaceae bacterium]|nr:hypothetical protein [Eggerthellaceae bacterium]
DCSVGGACGHEGCCGAAAPALSPQSLAATRTSAFALSTQGAGLAAQSSEQNPSGEDVVQMPEGATETTCPDGSPHLLCVGEVQNPQPEGYSYYPWLAVAVMCEHCSYAKWIHSNHGTSTSSWWDHGHNYKFVNSTPVGGGAGCITPECTGTNGSGEVCHDIGYQTHSTWSNFHKTEVVAGETVHITVSDESWDYTAPSYGTARDGNAFTPGDTLTVCSYCGTVLESSGNPCTHPEGKRTYADKGDGTHDVVCGECNKVIQARVPCTARQLDGYGYDVSSHWRSVCEKCGAKLGVEDHWLNIWSKGPLTHSRMCSVCNWNDTINSYDHEWEYVIEGDTHHKHCTVCGYDTQPQRHAFDKWNNDGETHWRECECGERDHSTRAKHEKEYVVDGSSWLVYDSHVAKCSVCDWKDESTRHTEDMQLVNTDPLEHYKQCKKCTYIDPDSYEEHEVADDLWNKDPEGHYEYCEVCYYAEPVQKHSMVGMSDPADHWVECEVCGYVEPDSNEEHIMEWRDEGYEHYQECSVCYFVDEGTREYHLDKFVYEPAGDGVSHNVSCPTCGLEDTDACEWEYVNQGDLGHWRKCKLCGFQEKQGGPHINRLSKDANGNAVLSCTVCGYTTNFNKPLDDKLKANIDKWEVIIGDDGKLKVPVKFSAWKQSVDHSGATVLIYVGNKKEASGEQKVTGGSVSTQSAGGLATQADDGRATYQTTGDIDWYEGVQVPGPRDEISIEVMYVVEDGADKLPVVTDKMSYSQVCGHDASRRYESAGDTGHAVICDRCNATLATEAHGGSGALHDDMGHWKYCDVCKSRYAEGAHALKATAVAGDAASHSLSCSGCDLKASEPHAWEKVSDDGGVIVERCACAMTRTRVKPAVKEGTATAPSVSKQAADQVGRGTAVLIDATTPLWKRDVYAAVIDRGTVGNVAASGNAAGLTVNFDGATATLDKRALGAVGEFLDAQKAKGDGGDAITLKVQPGDKAEEGMTPKQKAAVEGMDSAKPVAVSLSSGGGELSDLQGGAIELSVPYDADGALAGWHLDADGNKEAVPCSYADGRATLELPHCSLFAVAKAGAPAAIDSVGLSKASFVFNGKTQKPTVASVSAGGVALAPGFYDVKYENAKSKNAGAYKVTVTAKGGAFTGSKTVSYRIAKAENKLAAKAKSTQKKPLSAKAAKATSFKAAKYAKVSNPAKGKLTYKKASGDKKIKVNAKTGKLTVPKGLAKKTYKVKVKVVSAATTNYKPASKTITLYVKVK